MHVILIQLKLRNTLIVIITNMWNRHQAPLQMLQTYIGNAIRICFRDEMTIALPLPTKLKLNDIILCNQSNSPFCILRLVNSTKDHRPSIITLSTLIRIIRKYTCMTCTHNNWTSCQQNLLQPLLRRQSPTHATR